ncbi:MAG: hypothetical protein AAB462_00260 [Patescibacteria group bacterium]
MKQKDLILIVIVVFLSAIISFFVSTSLIVPSNNRQQKAEEVQAITSNFPQPDKDYFNDKAFDPTKLITIGQTSSSDPFSGAKQ